MLRLLSLLPLMAMVAACASPAYNYGPQVTNISDPPLNSINTAAIGDIMLRQGRSVVHDALDISARISMGSYTVSPGEYLKEGDRDGTQFFAMHPRSGGSGIQTGFLGDPPKLLAVKSNGQICVVTTLNTTNCRHSPDFEVRPVASVDETAFQQTLIYNGRVGNKINIAYREFSNDLARPAFNNEVEYDLSESSEIGYKGAYLQILEATNTRIRYKVLRNFNQASY